MNKGESRLIPAVEVSEGAGVRVQRTIGTATLRHLDPFMMLDFFGSDDPDEYLAGFPSHPHRGFNTFTYMIDGFTGHQDSMGNTGLLGPGAAQWMKAGSGVIHSEMPRQENGLLRGFQLWINLPASNKMDAPEYHEYAADAFPVVETSEGEVKVLIGHYGEVQSPILDPITQVSYFDVKLRSGKAFSVQLNPAHNSCGYLFEGEGQCNGQAVASDTLLLSGREDGQLDFVAGSRGARLIVISGRPIGEPVVQHGPFVMNTREEIDQALRDFQSDNFVRDKARVTTGTGSSN